METEVLTNLALEGGGISPDLSVWRLFLSADFIVKVVIFLLLACSFWSWTIIFEKTRRFRRLYQQAATFERDFWSGGSLEEFSRRIGEAPDHPMAMVFASAMREWRRFASRGAVPGDPSRLTGLQQRISHAMEVTLNRELDKLERYLGFLATVGSTAPFVGLFGTVWGIMNSFQSIAATKNTSLAVVAPGIAEALLATALGLVAAIPAVVAYNKLTGDLDRYATRLGSFATEFRAILSRQLEERSA